MKKIMVDLSTLFIAEHSDRDEEAIAGGALATVRLDGETRRVHDPEYADPLDPSPLDPMAQQRLAKELADTTKRALSQLDVRVAEIEKHIWGPKAYAVPANKEANDG